MAVTARSIDGLSRRQFLAKATSAGGAAFLASWAGPVIEKAYGAGPCTGHLTDIEHFVLLMQENRSFDHYFGTLSGTEGFNSAPPSAFQQPGWNPKTQSLDPAGITIPYRFDTTRGPLLNGACLVNLENSWITIHNSWNGGANNNWLPAQTTTQSAANVPQVMGYYQREDIPIHHMLADAFTICDRYHCSLLGPTSPNRLYWFGATIDPAGTAGGPELQNPSVAPFNKYSWTIMPENLSAAGVSWKVYTSKILGPINTLVSYPTMVGHFKQAADPKSDLARYGLAPTYPADFAADVIANKLPQVSWLVPGFNVSEHPAFPAALGAITIVNTLRILLSNPAVWEKTALIVSYDETGGFFDHVVPPTPPAGTAGEFISVPDLATVPGSGGIRGPIGLGFRVPCFVISPFSRGPLMVHDVFDHTSQLRLLETRFGVPVPNLTAWRRSVTGDMTSTLNFAVAPNPTPPNLDHPGLAAVPKLVECGPDILLGYEGRGRPYRVPYPQTMPTQESAPTRGIPSGTC